MPFKHRDESVGDRHSNEHRGTEVDYEEETNQSDEKDLFKEESMNVIEYPIYAHKESSLDAISEILDAECGEPFMSQQLRIDFNPLEGLDDTEYMLKKCTSFWKLVQESPVIQHLKVLPQKSTLVGNSKSSESSTLEGLPSAMEEAKIEPLEIIEKQGRIMSDIFATKFKQNYCEEGSGDFIPDSPRTSKAGIGKSHEVTAKSRTEITQDATRSRQQDSNALKKSGSVSKAREKLAVDKQRKEVTKLCQELDKWDEGNVKSMEPPAHPLAPSYAVLQKSYKLHSSMPARQS